MQLTTLGVVCDLLELRAVRTALAAAGVDARGDRRFLVAGDSHHHQTCEPQNLGLLLASKDGPRKALPSERPLLKTYWARSAPRQISAAAYRLFRRACSCAYLSKFPGYSSCRSTGKCAFLDVSILYVSECVREDLSLVRNTCSMNYIWKACRFGDSDCDFASLTTEKKLWCIRFEYSGKAYHLYAYECAAAGEIAAWTCAGKSHSGMVWFLSGYGNAELNTTSLRRLLDTGCIGRASLRGDESAYAAGDLLLSQRPEKRRKKNYVNNLMVWQTISSVFFYSLWTIYLYRIYF